jgi:hypothetical protein
MWDPFCGVRRGLLFRIYVGLGSIVTLGSGSLGTYDHILLSQIPDSLKPGGSAPRIYILQEQGDLGSPSRLPPQAMNSLSSPPLDHRATVVVFEPASLSRSSSQYSLGTNRIKYGAIINSSTVACISFATEWCLPSRCLTTDFVIMAQS